MNEVKNAMISDCLVRLDGNAFVDCSFHNVVFEFAGGEFIFSGNKVDIYVLSFVGPFATSLAALRGFAADIGNGARIGVGEQLTASIGRPH